MMSSQKMITRNSVKGTTAALCGGASLGRDSYVQQLTPDRQHSTAAPIPQKHTGKIKIGTWKVRTL